jgi:hypothetical protein
MGMVCWVLELAPAQIDALRTTPSLTPDLVEVVQMQQTGGRIDEFLKAFPERGALLAKARERISALRPLEPGLCLEKSWHILHYLLTGHIGPANAPGDLLLTGEGLGEDLGYGPVRLHAPPATRAFDVFLQSQDVSRLQARLNLGEMRLANVYLPFGKEQDNVYEAELRNEIGTFFSLLRDYVRKASDRGDGLLVWIS